MKVSERLNPVSHISVEVSGWMKDKRCYKSDGPNSLHQRRKETECRNVAYALATPMYNYLSCQ